MQLDSELYRSSSPSEVYFPTFNVREVSDLTVSEYKYNIEMIGALKLHDKGYKGGGIKIGVIDSGCAQDGPDFVKNFFIESDNNDNNGHGTHVVSIIKEIAPGAMIYMAKAMDKTGGGSLESVAKAAKWLIEQRVDVINCSFAFNTNNTEIFSLAVNEGVAAGITFVCATGNDGASHVSFPANKDNVFAVGAIDSEFNLASFSNTGIEVDLVAPGVEIVGIGTHGQPVTMSGTSQATPHVTAMIALFFQYNGKIDFHDTYSRITKTSVEDLGTKGPDNSYGYGLIQPYFAGESGKVAIASSDSWFKKIIKFLFG